MKGFGSNKLDASGLTGRDRARIAGAKGGRISKRGKRTGGLDDFQMYYEKQESEPKQ